MKIRLLLLLFGLIGCAATASGQYSLYEQVHATSQQDVLIIGIGNPTDQYVFNDAGDFSYQWHRYVTGSTSTGPSWASWLTPLDSVSGIAVVLYNGAWVPPHYARMFYVKYNDDVGHQIWNSSTESVRRDRDYHEYAGWYERMVYVGGGAG